VTTLLTQLKDCLSQTVSAGNKFVEDDANYFRISHQLSLLKLKKSFSGLKYLAEQLQRWEKELKDSEEAFSRKLQAHLAIQNAATAQSGQETAELIKFIAIITIVWTSAHPLGKKSRN